MEKKNKQYKVKITKTAWETLTAHAEFVAKVSAPAANRLVDAFLEATERLTEMPERNPWLERDDVPYQQYRKLLFGKRYLALYEIRDETVFVTTVVDCRQEFTWML
jgi:plasmid stabilization system protein ParE